ncbi:MAG TPA: DNA-processing protein DprA [Steroidobacteraceae bacterium]|nr:DNA-processing protein DprA [Steroidobacteraceae bacterium]
MMLARAPGLMAEQARALLETAGGEAALESALRPDPERDSSRAPRPGRVGRACRELAEAASQWRGGTEFKQSTLRYLSAPDEAELRADLAWLESSGARAVLCTDAQDPPLLAQTQGAPSVLFVLGSVDVLHSPQLAMVGTRRASPMGRQIALEFSAGLARAGLTITSGLAAGIDAASHEGALRAGGLSVAVFGTGLDTVYPPENRRLAGRIRERGALVSEFPPRTPPSARNFPRRNRVISGLSLGTLVIEAAQRSGSLVTARLAGEQGREVFAIPGSIRNPLARGCHKLIRQGAKLVEDAAGVLSELQIILPEQRVTGRESTARVPGALDKEYEMLLDALGFEPATIDALAARTGLPGGSVASMLLILELEGCVAALPGGRYDRIT